MVPNIFDVSEGKVVVNPECLLIPELKAVVEAYSDPIPALAFLKFKYDIKGPYCNVPEEDKEEILLADFPGEYTLEDDAMVKAMDKLDMLTTSSSVRYYLDNKILMEKLGKFARTAPITTGRDGNLTALANQLKFCGKAINEFKQLERVVQQELDEFKSKVRGQKRKAYDQ